MIHTSNESSTEPKPRNEPKTANLHMPYSLSKLPPLSLYIHIPWCIRKCPYCDFNSYERDEALPIQDYVEALKRDLSNDLDYVQGRSVKSIFFGGGTPSLFPASAIKEILDNIRTELSFDRNIEITLETNPGTAEYSRFDVLREAGVNRLSFGAQSFDDTQLQRLGRIHSSNEIFRAIEQAKTTGFDNINIDLMHGLQDQNIDQAILDLKQALSLEPKHLSWYQLTIEPNTAFYSTPPPLPDDDLRTDIYVAGRQFLADQGFDQYEVSAYSKSGCASKHNMNYWEFGDYLAIGAGAHGKISLIDEQKIVRFHKTRNPKDYLRAPEHKRLNEKAIATRELPLEFMMNTLRLVKGVDASLFEERTGLALDTITTEITHLQDQGWLRPNDSRLQTTPLGYWYLDSILNTFM